MLTDTELQDIAREYLEKMGFGNQPYMVYKHEDIDRHLSLIHILSSSFGMICPRHSVLKLLCIRLRSFVVLVK